VGKVASSQRGWQFALALLLLLVAASMLAGGLPVLWIVVCLLLILATGAVPFAVGLVVQLALRKRELPLSAVIGLAVLLALPSWLWHVGVTVDVAGPVWLSEAATLLFVFIFVRKGADAARKLQESRHAREARLEGEA